MAKTNAPNQTKTAARPTSLLRPRESALAPEMLARVFHQPSLIYFQAAAKHLSIREAARRLNIASSAVTRQIAQLEDALGISLFHRDKRRLKLTSAGEILFRHANKLTAPMEAAISELEMLRGIKTGTVRIASVESVGISFLPALISSFGKEYPRLSLDVSILSAADVVEQLLAESIDIGFSFIAKQPTEIEVCAQHEVGIGVIMRPDHPLTNNACITIADCMRVPAAVARPEISIREVIEPFLNQNDGTLPPLVEVNSIRMLVELALHGHYLSITTPIGAQQEINSGDLVFRPLTDPGLPTNRFGILVRAAGELQFAPAVFYEHAMAHFENIRFPGET